MELGTMNRAARRQTWRKTPYGRVLRVYGTMKNYYTRRAEKAHLRRA